MIMLTDAKFSRNNNDEKYKKSFLTLITYQNIQISSKQNSNTDIIEIKLYYFKYIYVKQRVKTGEKCTKSSQNSKNDKPGKKLGEC